MLKVSSSKLQKVNLFWQLTKKICFRFLGLAKGCFVACPIQFYSFKEKKQGEIFTATKLWIDPLGDFIGEIVTLSL